MAPRLEPAAREAAVRLAHVVSAAPPGGRNASQKDQEDVRLTDNASLYDSARRSRDADEIKNAARDRGAVRGLTDGVCAAERRTSRGHGRSRRPVVLPGR